MYLQTLEQLGLAKNEAKIYTTLLKEGELSIGEIATWSKVHRRNVYDSIKRLIEKGLVFEIIQAKENRYQAVDPNKLKEIIQEKEILLNKIMPDLEHFFLDTPHKQEVYIYRGAEGWKNYMRDMLRTSKEAHFIGAKGGWLDSRVKNYFPQFIKEAKKKKIKFYHLFDHEVKEKVPEIIPHIGKNYRFLPKGYSTKTGIDIFADRVNIVSEVKYGYLEEDFSVTVVVNKHIADAFRIWFKFMWDFCPEN